MAAYFVIDLDIHDAAGFEAYAHAVSAILEQYGARYLVRRRPVEVLEGAWHPNQLTVIRFPSRERARAFYESAEFRAVVGLRWRSARTNLVLVDEPQGAD